VEIPSSANAGKGLSVTTLVTGWVFLVYLGNSVKGLMEITNIVDDHTESE